MLYQAQDTIPINPILLERKVYPELSLHAIVLYSFLYSMVLEQSNRDTLSLTPKEAFELQQLIGLTPGMYISAKNQLKEVGLLEEVTLAQTIQFRVHPVEVGA
ncbi:MAG: hypothetical protein Q4B80_01880 [Aerococcaceae bacterium]|nr:hypothetical protein [Aerococcaceae bacterium]